MSSTRGVVLLLTGRTIHRPSIALTELIMVFTIGPTEFNGSSATPHAAINPASHDTAPHGNRQVEPTDRWDTNALREVRRSGFHVTRFAERLAH